MIRIPRLADSTVPAVDGETKRFRASICMIMPVMLVEAPTRMMATVRGIRLTSRTMEAWTSASPEIISRMLNP